MDDKEEKLQEQKKDGSERWKKDYLRGLVTGLILTAFLLSCVSLGKQIKQYATIKKSLASQELSSDTGEISHEKVSNAYTQKKIDIIQDTIEEYFLEEADSNELEAGVYRGMVEALGDPYSTYYTAKEWQDMQNQTQGIYFGIGAYIGVDKETQLPKIAKIIPNTPAEVSGRQAEDIIMKVDGVETAGMDATEVVSRVKGKEGTKVMLTVYRDGITDYLNIEVERKKIENPTVEYKMLEGRIGYIQINEFDDVTVDQFSDAYVTLNGNEMKGLILDLRGNPGGNLTAVTEIANMILPKGLIVYTEDKYGKRVEYNCDGKNEIQIPMYVLINGYSASASEILAGAIKDYEKGILLGTTTYGKGIVQRMIPLSDGSAVKLTVSNYFTPKGNNIHKIGIEPDVTLEFDGDSYLEDGTDNQLIEATKLIKELMN